MDKTLTDDELETLFDDDLDTDLDEMTEKPELEPETISPLDNKESYPGYLELLVNKLETDPVAYKPYSPEYTPLPALVVRMPLNEKYVLSYDLEDEVLIVNMEGLKAIMAKLADAVQDMNAARNSGKKY